MRVLVALGGNAILRRGGTGTASEQLRTLDETCRQLVRMVKAGHEVVITHGNGPQVGDILLAYDAAKDVLPPMPLDVCGAQSQGMIGYMLQQSLENELAAAGVGKSVAVVVTQTLISEDEEALSTPVKPIGPYYAEECAKRLEEDKGWQMRREGEKGFRRVVPSPEPVEIVEAPTIRRLFAEGTIVIAAGGGGIPVVKDKASGGYKGVEAVIDKDLASALLASALGVEVMVILTDVEGAYLEFGKRTRRLLKRVTVQKVKQYIGDGEFGAGSMAPKMAAAVRFMESGGRMAVVTSLQSAGEALSGESGTVVVP